MIMVSRITKRYISRRFLSNRKVLSEDEKAAENVSIKKLEQEKAEKLAHKGTGLEERSVGGSGSSAADAKPTSSSVAASLGKYRNYMVMAGIVTSFGSLGWYLNSNGKETKASS